MTGIGLVGPPVLTFQKISRPMTLESDPRTGSPSAALSNRVVKAVERFLAVESSSGIVLLVATIAALLWANSAWSDSYTQLWHTPVTFGFGSFESRQSLHFWINDGLMTVFFLIVGVEIRTEMHEGALANLRQAALPIAAAAGGVLVPAVIYLTFADTRFHHGWAVPTATDIAFAVGILALLGKRVPHELRVLLLALAIIDDIAAILIIALFYSEGVALSGLALTGLGALGILALQRLNVQMPLIYVIPGAVVWSGLLHAGVHPTLAGVIIGLLTPVRAPRTHMLAMDRAMGALIWLRENVGSRSSDSHRIGGELKQLETSPREILSPASRVQYALHPWVAFAIMPLFALANAGVLFNPAAFRLDGSISIMTGIVLGLLVGKPAGIVLTALLFVRLGWCSLPKNVTQGGILVVGSLAGIGFTMAIFIANLAFADSAMLDVAKLAVLVGSTMAAIIGLSLGRSLLSRSTTI